MASVFLNLADYGATISYQWNNKINESFTGVDYCNAQWLHPITKINFSESWLDQNRYDYLVGFYNLVSGNQDIFLIQDPLDYSVTYFPFSNLGIVTQGIILNINGELRLVKQYKLTISGIDYFINRPITRPKNVLFYNNLGTPKNGITVNPDTGVVIGAVEFDLWSGEFYIPVRFENDNLPLEIVGYDDFDNVQTYRLPDLQITEEKELLFDVANNLLPSYNHYLQVSPSIGTQIQQKSKTDVYIGDSGYSDRDSLNSYRWEVSYSDFLAEETTVNYLVGLQRLCLGEYSNFQFADVEGDIDNRFRFLNPVSYRTASYSEGRYLFNVSGLNFIQDDVYNKTTFCHIWKIVRQNGGILWHTNHDNTFLIGGETVSPLNSFNATSNNRTHNITTDSTELTSTFGLAVTESDVIAGKYRYADLEVSLFNWITKTIVTRLFTGNIGGYTIGYLPTKGKQYQFQAISLGDKLDSTRTVQTSSTCRHQFGSQGYGNCNVNLANVTVTTTATSGTVDEITLGVSGNNFESYLYGKMKFTSGALEGFETEIEEVTGRVVKPLYPLPFPPSGESVLLLKYCNKTIANCQTYNNVVNFGAQPRLPGVDETLSQPE